MLGTISVRPVIPCYLLQNVVMADAGNYHCQASYILLSVTACCNGRCWELPVSSIISCYLLQNVIMADAGNYQCQASNIMLSVTECCNGRCWELSVSGLSYLVICYRML